MFALCGIDPFESVNLKCGPEEAIRLRQEYRAVKPGYHMNKQHWNTVAINQDVADSHLLSMTDKSYELIYNSLSKKIKNGFGA
jgi:predicted DNA-binding protein (MmcQ/YjbR family)